MENDKKIIENLRKMFTITVASFALMQTIASTFSGKPKTINTMHSLHLQMLDELNQETPRMVIVDILLAKMEEVAKILK